MPGISSPMTKPVRALCSMFGATAVELVAAGDFGKMVAFTGLGVKRQKISEAVGRLKPFHPTAISRAPRGRWEFPWEINRAVTDKDNNPDSPGCPRRNPGNAPGR